MKTQEVFKPEVVPKYEDQELNKVLKANELLHKKQKQLEDFEDLLKIKEEREQKRKSYGPLFFNISMALSILLVYTAFNWKTYEKEIIDLGQLEQQAEEVMDIPISKQPPPPPPTKAPEVFTIKEVKDEEIIEDLDIRLDVEVTEESRVEVVEYVPIEPVEEEKVEEIFTIVESAPEPYGGFAAFNRYVAENISYPKTAARMNVSGMVFVKFVVEKDGSLTDATVVKGIGAGCDEEAIRVIESAPKWKPGKQRGQPVRVYKVVPIRFMLKN